MGNGLKEKWSDFAMKFGMGFLGMWNKKHIVFPVLIAITIILGIWWMTAQYLWAMFFCLFFAILTIILGLTGLITMPMVTKDLTKTVKVVTATLGVIIPVVVAILAFTFWMLWPVLFVGAEPDLNEEVEFVMTFDKAEMGGYSIEGRVEYRGQMTTYIRADEVKLWNFTQYHKNNIISDPGLTTVKGLDLYVTYVKSTGIALGVKSATAWNGDENPPFVVSLMADPMEMWDVTMHVVGIGQKETTFETIEIKSEVPGTIKTSETAMEGWSITGPAEYNGVNMTSVIVDKAGVVDLIQYYEGLTITANLGNLTNMRLNCTHIIGTADVEGMVTTMEWNGTEEPPWLLEMLDDPAVMTDVTMDTVYLRSEDVVLENMTQVLEMDYDGDGLSHSEEVALGTDPLIKDSDGDGVSDGEEVASGTDPLDPENH